MLLTTRSFRRRRRRRTDFDDQNPRFADEKYSLIMDESQTSSVGQPLRVAPRQLHAEDGDKGIMAPVRYSLDQLLVGGAASTTVAPKSPAAEHSEPLSVERYLHLNEATGELRLIRQWPANNHLLTAAPLTLLVRATQVDNSDRYALTTLTITTPKSIATAQQPKHADRVEFVNLPPENKRLNLSVAEDTPPSTQIGRVRAVFVSAAKEESGNDQQPVDLIVGQRSKRPAIATGARAPPPPPPSALISYQLLDDQSEQFAVSSDGEISLRKPLDFEQRQEFRFRVLAAYKKHSDVCSVQVQVLNVNDNKPKVGVCLRFLCFFCAASIKTRRAN